MVENTAQRKTSHDVKAVFITSIKHYIMPELSIKYMQLNISNYSREGFYKQMDFWTIFDLQ